jgi:hypothetical protein
VWASLGGVGFAAGVPAPHPDRAARPLAVLGAVTVTGANGSFIYGMLKAGDTGWADLGTLLPIAAATVLYGVFVVVERAARAPLMRLSLLSRRRVAAGAFWMLVASGVLIAGLFLGSHYLQRSRFLALRVRPAGITPRRQAAAHAGGARWELPVRWLLAEWPADKPEPVLIGDPVLQALAALLGVPQQRRIDGDGKGPCAHASSFVRVLLGACPVRWSPTRPGCRR